MNWRVLSVAMSCFFGMWPVTSYSQDDETKTQALLDQHKEADPTNSARSLTSKPRLSERVTSEVPLPRGPSPETEKLIAKLEKQKEAFVTRRVKAEGQKRAGEVGVMAVTPALTEQNAKRDWEKTDAAKDLRRLKAKAAKDEKAQRNGGVGTSEVPLPQGKHD